MERESRLDLEPAPHGGTESPAGSAPTRASPGTGRCRAHVWHRDLFTGKAEFNLLIFREAGRSDLVDDMLRRIAEFTGVTPTVTQWPAVPWEMLARDWDRSHATCYSSRTSPRVSNSIQPDDRWSPSIDR